MKTQTFTTRDEAIDRLIVAAIEAGDVQDAREEFDIDAIADEVLGGYDQGFAQVVDEDGFWAIVAAHADTANLDEVLHRVVADDLGSGGLTVSWDEDARRYVAEQDFGTVIPDDIATWSYSGGLSYQYDYGTVTDDSGLLELYEFVDSVAQLEWLVPGAIMALRERRTVTIAKVIVPNDDLEWDEQGYFVDDSGDVMDDNIAGWAIIYSVHKDD